MRILFDSKKPEYKTPFGTVTPKEKCILHIHIPISVPVVSAACTFTFENGNAAFSVPMVCAKTLDNYHIFRGEFSIAQPGLYFYYFQIQKADSSFRLFKQGSGTNMEDGEMWQLSCIPADFTTPD